MAVITENVEVLRCLSKLPGVDVHAREGTVKQFSVVSKMAYYVMLLG